MDMNCNSPLPFGMNRCTPGFIPPNGEDSRPPSDSIDPALLSLAMGYVPFQAWETPYEVDVALQRGTIFPSLDKPFIGEEAVPR